jgi:hypothetical protein
MNAGLFEIALLLGSVAGALIGARAAFARQRSAALLALNAVFTLVLAYFTVQGLRFGSIVAVGLGLLAAANGCVAWAIIARAAPKAPVA